MLIQSRLTKIENSTLIIPIWNRAPVNITDNSKVYVSSINNNTSSFREIIISPYDPEIWGDIWRAEFDVHERLGLLSEVFELISEEGITILNSETSSFDGGESHSISLILDCREYHSQLDKNFGNRIKKPLPTLQDLYIKLANQLIEDLIFHDGNNPRLRIKRLSSYYRFYTLLKSGKLNKPAQIVVKKGKIKIPNYLIIFPKSNPENPKSKNLNAMVLTDSKERIIRTIFCNDSQTLFHITIACENDNSVFPKILKFFSNAGLNVVRFHLRPSYLIPSGRLKIKPKNELAKIDLLIRHTQIDGKVPNQYFFSALKDQIKEVYDITPIDFCDISPQPFSE